MPRGIKKSLNRKRKIKKSLRKKIKKSSNRKIRKSLNKRRKNKKFSHKKMGGSSVNASTTIASRNNSTKTQSDPCEVYKNQQKIGIRGFKLDIDPDFLEKHKKIDNDAKTIADIIMLRDSIEPYKKDFDINNYGSRLELAKECGCFVKKKKNTSSYLIQPSVVNTNIPDLFLPEFISRQDYNSKTEEKKNEYYPLIPGDEVFTKNAFGIKDAAHYGVYIGSFNEQELGRVMEVDSLLQDGDGKFDIFNFLQMLVIGAANGIIRVYRDMGSKPPTKDPNDPTKYKDYGGFFGKWDVEEGSQDTSHPIKINPSKNKPDVVLNNALNCLQCKFYEYNVFNSSCEHFSSYINGNNFCSTQTTKFENLFNLFTALVPKDFNLEEKDKTCLIYYLYQLRQYILDKVIFASEKTPLDLSNQPRRENFIKVFLYSLKIAKIDNLNKYFQKSSSLKDLINNSHKLSQEQLLNAKEMILGENKDTLFKIQELEEIGKKCNSIKLLANIIKKKKEMQNTETQINKANDTEYAKVPQPGPKNNNANKANNNRSSTSRNNSTLGNECDDMTPLNADECCDIGNKNITKGVKGKIKRGPQMLSRRFCKNN